MASDVQRQRDFLNDLKLQYPLLRDKEDADAYNIGLHLISGNQELIQSLPPRNQSIFHSQDITPQESSDALDDIEYGWSWLPDVVKAGWNESIYGIAREVMTGKKPFKDKNLFKDPVTGEIDRGMMDDLGVMMSSMFLTPDVIPMIFSMGGATAAKTSIQMSMFGKKGVEKLTEAFVKGGFKRESAEELARTSYKKWLKSGQIDEIITQYVSDPTSVLNPKNAKYLSALDGGTAAFGGGMMYGTLRDAAEQKQANPDKPIDIQKATKTGFTTAIQWAPAGAMGAMGTMARRSTALTGTQKLGATAAQLAGETGYFVAPKFIQGEEVTQDDWLWGFTQAVATNALPVVADIVARDKLNKRIDYERKVKDYEEQARQAEKVKEEAGLKGDDAEPVNLHINDLKAKIGALKIEHFSEKTTAIWDDIKRNDGTLERNLNKGIYTDSDIAQAFRDVDDAIKLFQDNPPKNKAEVKLYSALLEIKTRFGDEQWNIATKERTYGNPIKPTVGIYDNFSGAELLQQLKQRYGDNYPKEGILLNVAETEIIGGREKAISLLTQEPVRPADTGVRQEVKGALRDVGLTAEGAALSRKSPITKGEFAEKEATLLNYEGRAVSSKRKIGESANDRIAKVVQSKNQKRSPKHKRFKEINNNFDKTAVVDWMKHSGETGTNANTVITFVKFLNDRKKTLADLTGKDIINFAKEYKIIFSTKAKKYESIWDKADSARWSAISKFLQRARDEGFIRKYDTAAVKGIFTRLNEVIRKGKEPARKGIRRFALSWAKDKNPNERLASRLGGIFGIRSDEVGALKRRYLKQDQETGEFYIDITPKISKTGFARKVWVDKQTAKLFNEFFDKNKKITTTKLANAMKPESDNIMPYFDFRRRIETLSSKSGLTADEQAHVNYWLGHDVTRIGEIYKNLETHDIIALQKGIHNKLSKDIMDMKKVKPIKTKKKPPEDKGGGGVKPEPQKVETEQPKTEETGKTFDLRFSDEFKPKNPINVTKQDLDRFIEISKKVLVKDDATVKDIRDLTDKADILFKESGITVSQKDALLAAAGMIDKFGNPSLKIAANKDVNNSKLLVSTLQKIKENSSVKEKQIFDYSMIDDRNVSHWKFELAQGFWSPRAIIKKFLPKKIAGYLEPKIVNHDIRQMLIISQAKAIMGEAESLVGKNNMKYLTLRDEKLASYFTDEGSKLYDKKAVDFLEKMNTKGTNEYNANLAIQNFYDFIYTSLRKVAKREKSPVEFAEWDKKFKKKYVDSYFTRQVTEDAAKYLDLNKTSNKILAVEKAIADAVEKLTERSLRPLNKEISNIQSKIALTSGVEKARLERLLSKALRDKEKKIQDIDSKEKPKIDTYIRNIHRPKNAKEVKNKNFEFERDVDVPLYLDQDRKIQTYETDFNKVFNQYARTQARFLATAYEFPEFTLVAGKHTRNKGTQIARNWLAADHSGVYSRYVHRVLGDQLFGAFDTSTQATSKFATGVATTLSALGLSSPMSGIKNSILGDVHNFASYGSAGFVRSWMQLFDRRTRVRAAAAGATDAGSTWQEGLSWGEGLSSKPIKVSRGIFKASLMTQSEIANRTRAMVAGNYRNMIEAENLIGNNVKKRNIALQYFTDTMKLAPEEIAVIQKYGLEPSNIPKSDMDRFFSKQAYVQAKLDMMTHAATQGLTTTPYMPLWTKKGISRPLTVFMKMAYAATSNVNNNVVKPVALGSYAPLVRYFGGGIIGGEILWGIYENLIGMERATPELDDRLLENLRRVEVLGIGTNIMQNYSEKPGIAGTIESYTPFFARTLDTALRGIHEILFAKSVPVGIGVQEFLTKNIAGYAHYKRVSAKENQLPLAKYKKARTVFSRFLDKVDETKYYSNKYRTNEKQWYYTSMRDAYLKGEIDRLGKLAAQTMNFIAHKNLESYHHADVKDPQRRRRLVYKDAKKQAQNYIKSIKPFDFSVFADEKGRPKTSRQRNLRNAFLKYYGKYDSSTGKYRDPAAKKEFEEIDAYFGKIGRLSNEVIQKELKAELKRLGLL